MKGNVVKFILKTVDENPNRNIYKVLEEKGYLRDKAWMYIPRLKRWGYLQQIGKSKYILTEKGRKHLNRLLYGLAECPFCGSNRIKLNGKRDGTGKQRYLCNGCGFTWAQGKKEEAIVRALKRVGKAFFIVACEQRYSYHILNYLKEFMQEMNLKNTRLIVL